MDWIQLPHRYRANEAAIYFLPLSYHRFKVSYKSCCQLFFNSHVLIANCEKYTLADCALSINSSKKGWGYAPPKILISAPGIK